MDEDKEFIKARDYAYKLLSYRQRSTREIDQRLNKKGFTAQVTKKTIAYLTGLDYLNDENFAQSWVQTRMQFKPCGWLLLRYQLRQKGVSEEILDKVWHEYGADYDEVAQARKLVSLRRHRYQSLEPIKLKRRLYDYLRRRGFSQEAISQALE